MQTVSATQTINVDLSAVWPLISDVTQIAHWHPSIASVDLLTAKPTGLHAARRCHFKDGTSVREEVLELSDAKKIRFRLSEFSVPMKRLELQIETSAPSAGATSVTLSLHYEVKFGLLGQLLGATVMRRELSKMAARIVAGRASYANTNAFRQESVTA